VSSTPDSCSGGHDITLKSKKMLKDLEVNRRSTAAPSRYSRIKVKSSLYSRPFRPGGGAEVWLYSFVILYVR